MGGRLYVGTSGFSYAEWKGVFYPEGLTARGFLSYYASRFPAVEINYTFRQTPSVTTLAAWAGQTPQGFRFALKGHQRVTHWKRLADAEEDVSAFLERVRTLGDRLGPILYQCPPTLRFDRALIEAFAGYLPPVARFAVEFRHPSWDEARPILRDLGVAWCTAETDEDEVPPAIEFEPFGYLRLRKTSYTDDELRAWAERIAPAVEAGRDVYVFFKHEEKGAGPVLAERLQRLVGA